MGERGASWNLSCLPGPSHSQWPGPAPPASTERLVSHHVLYPDHHRRVLIIP